jgi:F-type H+-transporting ATPase subunit alpha
MIIFAVTNGYLDDVKVADIRKWESDFLEFVSAQRPQIGTTIRTKRVLDDELTAQLKKAIEDFKAMS